MKTVAGGVLGNQGWTPPAPSPVFASSLGLLSSQTMVWGVCRILTLPGDHAASWLTWEPRGKGNLGQPCPMHSVISWGGERARQRGASHVVWLSPESSATTAPDLAAYWCASGHSEPLLVARVRTSHKPAESKKSPILDWPFPLQPWQSACTVWHKHCLWHWDAGDVMALNQSCCNTTSKRFVSWSQLLQYISRFYWQIVLR